MRFQCEIQLSYHKNPSYKPNRGKALISLAKKTPQASNQHTDPSPVHYLVVSSRTGSRLSDTRYKLDENILSVTKKFCKDGMTTLKLEEPPHTLSISKAEPGDIQKLVRVLEMIQHGDTESNDEFEPLSSMCPIKLKDIKPNPTSMVVSSKSKYPLTTLPQSLERFTAEGVELVKFDQRLSRLKNLRQLDLSANSIRELPDCINEMKLTDLWLPHNQLERLPEAFGTGQLAKHLIDLDLSNNNISTLRIEFYGFRELRYLYLFSNNLTELHPNLQSFQNLKTLNINLNKLKSIPISIYKLRNLDHLDITGNPFTDGGVKSKHGNISLPCLFELAFRKLKSSPKIIELFRKSIPPLLQNKLDQGTECPCGKYFYDTYLTYYSYKAFDLQCRTVYKPHKVTLEIPLCAAKCINKVEQYKYRR
eukprot:TRINITY_DN9295_c2_g1_i1.p1 TRINITY_DN9295_c2_g1~~TRINITY_DN9295_c2_g1_i1.p1  ORF type:complete len:420 (-),score=64.26 TRINITY_DN9295_c2_g1_i1:184-1443(-)